MRGHRPNILSFSILLIILIVIGKNHIKGQIPVIDTFHTSINFTDGLIDSRWNTAEAFQLLANTTDSTPDDIDFSGYWKAGYNPENQLFYVLVVVKDDTVTSEEFINPDSLYFADHITVYNDLYNEGFSSQNNGCFNFSLYPKTEQYNGRIGSNSFSLGNHSYIDAIDKNITADGWFIELLFSFKNLLSEQEILFVDTIGFEVAIADNDNGFGERKHRLSWDDADVSAWANPSTMRDIILDQKLNQPFNPTCSASFDYEIISNNNEGRVQVSFNDQSTTNDEIINWSWEFGDNTYSLAQNPSRIYDPFQQNVNTCLYITTKYGCNSSKCQPVYLPPDQYSLSGKVHGAFNSSLNWKVLAFQQSGSEYQAMEYYILNNENFEFTTIEEGSFLLYAIPEEPDQNYFPTYFVNDIHWQQGELINVNAPVYDVDIHLNEQTFSVSGPGTISGNINQLKEGIPIILTGENGNQLKYTLTNASGDFSFNELPFGNYIVYPEYPGIDNTGFTIHLSPENPDWDGIQFLNQNALLVANSIKKQSDYRIYYNQKQQELVIELVHGQTRNTKISVYSLTGELLYSFQSVFFASKAICTSNFHPTMFLVHIRDEKSICTEIIIK